MICKNCNAHFDDNLPSCPYCQAFHYAGARKEYMGKLEDMKEELDDLHQVVPQLYHKEFRSQTKQARKVLLRIVIVFSILILLFFIGTFVLDPISRHDEKQTLLFMKEAYPVADQYYEAGDYEALLSFYQTSISENESADFYNWDHYPFLMCYENITLFREAAKAVHSKDFSEFDVQEMFYCCISNHYYQENYTMDETDKQLVSSYDDEMKTVINTFHLTDEEAEEFNILLNENHYPSWEKIQDFSKKIYQRIR